MHFVVICFLLKMYRNGGGPISYTLGGTQASTIGDCTALPTWPGTTRNKQIQENKYQMVQGIIRTLCFRLEKPVRCY